MKYNLLFLFTSDAYVCTSLVVAGVHLQFLCAADWVGLLWKCGLPANASISWLNVWFCLVLLL